VRIICPVYFQLILMGTEEGLFAQRLHDSKEEPAVRIGGVDRVYQLTELVEKGLVVIIAGRKIKTSTDLPSGDGH
jgi:hypothetical protein